MITVELVILFLLLEGFFSGNETGFVSVPLSYLRALSKKNRSARLVMKFLDKPERFFSTTLIGANIFQVATATLLAQGVYMVFGPEYSILATFIATPLIWIFAETVPKTIYRFYAKRIILVTVYPMRFFYYLFYPLSSIFSVMVKLVIAILGLKQKVAKQYTVTELTRAVREYFPEQVSNFFSNLLNFNNTKIMEIMIPWEQVIKLEEKDVSVSEARKLFSDVKIYRIPVILKRKCYILTLFDLIDVAPDAMVSELVSDALIVRPGEKVSAVLDKMKEHKQLLAVVKFRNKYIGIVTLEMIMDLLLADGTK